MKTTTDPILTARNPQVTDILVIKKVLAGEKDSYEILIRRYNTRLYRIARSILRTDVGVEDVMQNAYIKAYENLHQFQGKAQFSTWLTKILINESLAWLRKNSKQRKANLELSIDQNLNLAKYSGQSADSNQIHHQLKKLLEGAIDQLPDKYRSVFMMREVEGINVEDTAVCLNISKDNVKVRLHRAKAFLRDYLRNSLHEVELFEFKDPKCNSVASWVMTRINASKPV